MSKIALAPHPNGSGTYELSGPSTDTNYSISLPQGTGTLALAESSFGFRNKIINGRFEVFQRAASANITATPSYVAADRWMVYQSGSPGASFQTVFGDAPDIMLYGSSAANLRNCGKVIRNPSSSFSGALTLRQATEVASTFDLAKQQVTFSFWAKRGANFSGSGNNLTVKLYAGSLATDQSAAIMQSWTAIAVVDSSVTLNTSWTRYTFTVSFPPQGYQAGIHFEYTPFGTAGNDDSFSITGVQLEAGSAATPFEARPCDVELLLCKRFYQRDIHVVIGGGATPAAGKTHYCSVNFPVAFRAAPVAGSFSVVTAITNTNMGTGTWSNITAQRARYSATNTTAADAVYEAQVACEVEL